MDAVPSVNSVTYGVSYGPFKKLVFKGKSSFVVPKGSNFGSERVKLWFRKGQTPFEENRFLLGQTRQFLIGQ